MRRHQLIEEAKTELDVAYDQVKWAEGRIMRLEEEFNSRIDSEEGLGALMREKEQLQEKIDIEGAYQLQKRAVDRFSSVSSAFAVVGSVGDAAVARDVLRTVLFRTEETRDRKLDIDRALSAFAAGLIEYNKCQKTDECDAKVRDAWAAIEALLTDFGRGI